MTTEPASDPKKVLLVEDELAFRQVYKDALEAQGFKVIEAKNGKEALESIQVNTPDIILLDLVLPEISGFDVLAQVRNLPGDPRNTPIIVFSVLMDEVEKQRAAKLGANDFMVKGEEVVTGVIDRIKELLAQRP